jgi:hypothetical protein
MVAEIEVDLNAEGDARPLILRAVQVLVGEGETALDVEFGQLVLCLLNSPIQTYLIEPTTDGVRRDGQLQHAPDVLGRESGLLVCEKSNLLIGIVGRAAGAAAPPTVLQRTRLQSPLEP